MKIRKLGYQQRVSSMEIESSKAINVEALIESRVKEETMRRISSIVPDIDGTVQIVIRIEWDRSSFTYICSADVEVANELENPLREIVT